jgi:RNA polymerase sigma-70 factor (ECF subfamily)
MSDSEAGREDARLIARCLDGDRPAFDLLVSRHYRGVYNVIYRMLPSSDDAADVTQEAFLRAYTRLDTFNLGRSFPAWLRAIASNLCIDHLRRRRSQTVSLDQRLESGLEPADESPDASPENQLTVAEDSRRVLAAVHQLPEKQKAVLVLRHIEGMKLNEIAEALRMPVGTVKTMLFRGRAAVREMVGEL